MLCTVCTPGEGGIVNSADREAFASFGEEKWRAKFLLKRHIDLDEVYLKAQSTQYRVPDEFRWDYFNNTSLEFPGVYIFLKNHPHPFENNLIPKSYVCCF